MVSSTSGSIEHDNPRQVKGAPDAVKVTAGRQRR
jgi:hypothetical protein